MPNIQKVDVLPQEIYGLKIRTKNTDEMQSNTQKIAPLWAKFYEEVLPKLDETAIIYSVYHNYESNEYGEYDVLIGSKKRDTCTDEAMAGIEEGRYLEFPVKGELPQAIFETWERVWAYFNDPSVDERRSFMTDFEQYTSPTDVKIYIGVNYF